MLNISVYQHAFFENNIHSLSYADIIKAMPEDATAIFDDIMVNPNILERASTIIDCFEDTVQHNARMVLNHEYHKKEHMESVVLSLYALNILEAVLFKTSFLTSFAFKENGLMSTVADIISKIAIDETLHYGMTVSLLTRLREDPEWSASFVAVESRAYSLYQSAIEADYKWIDYLFEEEAQLFGINSDILKKYAEYNLANVMRSVQLTPLTENTFNPCLWASKYTKPGNLQVAQKEKTSGLYLLGIVDTDMSEEDWTNLS